MDWTPITLTTQHHGRTCKRAFGTTLDPFSMTRHLAAGRADVTRGFR